CVEDRRLPCAFQKRSPQHRERVSTRRPPAASTAGCTPADRRPPRRARLAPATHAGNVRTGVALKLQLPNAPAGSTRLTSAPSSGRPFAFRLRRFARYDASAGRAVGTSLIGAAGTLGQSRPSPNPILTPLSAACRAPTDEVYCTSSSVALLR